MTLKIGIIGAGAFGSIHLSGFSKNPNCELVAIASRTEEHARAASEEFLVPKVYSGNDSWEKMLDNEKLDVVSVCTPNYLHAPIILKAIEKNTGIDVEVLRSFNPIYKAPLLQVFPFTNIIALK